MDSIIYIGIVQSVFAAIIIFLKRPFARAFVNAVNKRERLSKRIFNLGGGKGCRISYEDFLNRLFLISGLGVPDFPDKSFAEQNFHCGYYIDGSELEDIVHFRKDSLESYFKKEELNLGAGRKFLSSLFQKPIKKYLLKKSDPFNACLTSKPIGQIFL